MNVAPSRKAKCFVISPYADDECEQEQLRTELIPAYQHMISASVRFDVQADKTGIEDNAVSVVIDKATAYMPLS